MTTTDDKKNFGIELKSMREAASLTRIQLAAELGIAEHTLRQVESGYQALGPAATKRAIELLSPQHQKDKKKESTRCWLAQNEHNLQAIVEIVRGPEFEKKVEQLVTTLGINPNRAAVIIVRETIEKRLNA